MVKTGMKVGDTFEEGERTFVIDEVVKEGYITHEKTEETEGANPEDTEEEKPVVKRGRRKA
jgi:hypothetical protein